MNLKLDTQRSPKNDHVLMINNLNVNYSTSNGMVRAVRDASITVHQGSTLGIVGESGSGKSTLGFSLIRSVPPPGIISDGEIMFDGLDLLALKEEEMRKVRGKMISMILQDPMTSLNPVLTVGGHLMEMIGAHEPKLSKEEKYDRATVLLSKLGISEERFNDYPHQFSGGMRQRLMIGLALALNPKLVIADEPTTSLDVLVEAQILDLLNSLKKHFSLTLILITHNIGIVAETCDRTIIMYAGQVVEDTSTKEMFEEPLHPYTQALLASVPNIKLDQQVLHWIPGWPPSLIDPPEGCSYHQRCPYALDKCSREEPPLISIQGGRKVKCFLFS